MAVLRLQDLANLFSPACSNCFYGSVFQCAFVRVNIHNLIPIYIQQDAMLHNLFYLETALHVSGGTATHHQERIQLYLQHMLFVTLLLLPAADSGR